jgi:hypothetical protein
MHPLKKIALAAAGIVLLAAALFFGYNGTISFYMDFYFIPLEKYGELMPVRWQDIVFVVVFYATEFGLFYSSYRLLKRAYRAPEWSPFRNENSAMNGSSSESRGVRK